MRRLILASLAAISAAGPAIRSARWAIRRECAPTPVAFTRAAAVFAGRVISVREYPERKALLERLWHKDSVPADSVDLAPLVRSARLAVDSVWAGPDSAALTVFTDDTGEGLYFVPGDRYLIVAGRTRRGILFATACTGAARLEDGGREVVADATRALGRPRRPGRERRRANPKR